MTTDKKGIVIGSGLGGLVSATLLAQSGYDVTVYEKNATLGGRLNYKQRDGFFIDTGPSWLMTIDLWRQIFDVLDLDFDTDLNVQKLKPGYRIFFKDDSVIVDMQSGDRKQILELFESFDPGSGTRLNKYLDHAKQNNKTAVKWFLYRPYELNFKYLFKREIFLKLGLFDFFKNVQSEINKITTNWQLQLILQWIMTFVGTPPAKTPALYTLMNHYDIDEGIYYPIGGMYEISKKIIEQAERAGVIFHTNSEVQNISIDENGVANGIVLNDGHVPANIVVSNSDVVHTHTKLVPERYQHKSNVYWENLSNSPAAFVAYVGIDGGMDNIQHHNFIFANNADKQFKEIYTEKVWPEDPFIYFTVPSITDKTIVPQGKNLLYILIPLAAGLNATENYYEKVFNKAIELISDQIGNINLKDKIEWQEFYTIDDMIKDFYAPGGSGFGLGHTLSQSAWFRPSTKHPRVKNLYLCGQSTNPGTGIANAAISGQVVYKRIMGIKHPHPLKRAEIKLYEK